MAKRLVAVMIVLIITYQSQKKTKEIEKCDAIIESMRFSV